MPWEFTEHHVRPNVFYWAPQAYKERQEVKGRRKEASDYYKKAQACLEDGVDVEAAEKLLELAVAAWPDNPRYLCALADCITHQCKDPERALPWYDQLIDAADSPAHRVARARASAALGWLEDAKADLDSALAADPHNGLYLKERGMVMERLGQTFEATLDLSAALPLLRDAGLPTSDALFNKGYSYKLLGNMEEAVKDVEAAMQIAPSVITIKMTLGCMYLAKRRYKDALDLFQIVATFKPFSAGAFNNLALAQYLLTTSEEDAHHKPGGVKKRPVADADKADTGSASSKAAARKAPAGDDEMSDNDDEAADQEAMFAHQGKANEDPRYWALSVIKGGARKAMTSDPVQRALIESALDNFNQAASLYADDAARQKAQAPSDGDVHALHEHEAAAGAHDGYLLMLTNKMRVPGTPVVHDREFEDGEIQYNRGLVHLVLGNLAQAEKDFQDALAGNPTHAHYPHYRAVVHGRKGELKEAVRWNTAALTLNPNYLPALYHLGLCLYLQSRNAEAIQRLDLALGLQPRNWAVMEARGRVLQELDRHAEALPALLDALSFCDPDEPPSSIARLHYAIAQSAIATHTPDLLRSSLREARLHGQDPASVYALRGLLAHREGKLRKALAYLSRACKLAPREARFLYDRSQIKSDIQDWEGALSDMSEALQRLPDAASLYYSRGMAYFTIREYMSALQDLERAAGLMLKGSVPQAPDGWSKASAELLSRCPSLAPSLAKSITLTGRSTISRSSNLSRIASRAATASPFIVPPSPRGFDSVASGTPTGPRLDSTTPDSPNPLRSKPSTAIEKALSVIAGSDASVSTVSTAQAEDKGTLRPDPRLWEGTKFMSNSASPPDLTPSLWYHLGICRAWQKDWPQAAAAFEKGVDCLPSHPAMLHELAKAYQAMGDHDSAVPQFTCVLALQPGNARALLRRGISKYATKDYEGAAADLEAARAMDPCNPALRVDYKTLYLRANDQVLGKPGEEAEVWDLQAFPPCRQLPQ